MSARDAKDAWFVQVSSSHSSLFKNFANYVFAFLQKLDLTLEICKVCRFVAVRLQHPTFEVRQLCGCASLIPQQMCV